ncbi:MAG: DUF3108 domain-containing protein, partial [Candidatus Neomarinimicrobiota bacterium]
MKYPLLILIGLTCLSGQNLPFKVGEKLEYTAQFNVLPVGEATLTVVAEELYQGKPALQVKYQASTGDVADHLFRIRDNINIWFDRQDMYTYRVEKKIEEGKFRKKISTFIDYYDSIAITNKDTVRINQGVRDPYSLFYYLRTRPLE